MSKQAVRQKMKTGPMMTTDPQQHMNRHNMIAREAYLRAEQRGFQGGDPVADWLEAEAEVDRALTAVVLKTRQ